jgi:predicted RNA-binding Zn ribbon-like protein
MPPSAPLSPDGPPFFLADHPAMDFLNSIVRLKGGAWDAMADKARFCHWMQASGMPGSRQAADAAMARTEGELAPILKEAQTLREATRGLLPQLASQDEASRRSPRLAGLIERLNLILSEACDQQRLELNETGALWQRVPLYPTPRSLLAPIAQAVGDLLMLPDFSRLRACEGTDCTLWFLDVSKGNRRRWCSMALCGNRAKVAAHRDRGRRLVSS